MARSHASELATRALCFYNQQLQPRTKPEFSQFDEGLGSTPPICLPRGSIPRLYGTEKGCSVLIVADRPSRSSIQQTLHIIEDSVMAFTRKSWFPLAWFDSKSSNTQSSHQNSSRRASLSSCSSRASACEVYGPPQVIHGTWIDEEKLRELLEKKYRGDYKLRVRISDGPTTA